jgi:dihydropteroate synthase
MTKDGDLRTVEKGESMGILSRPATRKYKHQFKDVVNSMLNNTFERRYTKLTDAGIKPRVNVQHSPGINTSKMEEHLAAIRKNGDTVVIQRGQKTIVKKGNITKIYGS